MSETDFNWFQTVWQRPAFDPDGTGFIEIGKLPEFAHCLLMDRDEGDDDGEF